MKSKYKITKILYNSYMGDEYYNEEGKIFLFGNTLNKLSIFEKFKVGDIVEIIIDDKNFIQYVKKINKE